MDQPSNSDHILQSLRINLEKLLAVEVPQDTHQVISETASMISAVLAELDQARTELLQAKQDKAKFVSIVTHELRIPLTAIKGYTDLLRQGIVGPVNDQQSKFLTVIRSNVDRMSDLIADLADMSHIQSGKLQLQPISVNLYEWIDENLKSWQSRFTEKKQSLNLEIEPGIPSLQLDPLRLNQVLGYILSNANRYTPEDGNISMRFSIMDGALMVEVQDDGIGISKHDQESIFEPFFRSEDPAVRESPGWGLSLHIAQLLVLLMGGEIGVQSEASHGSLFWVDIPIALKM
jgi:signal transduction histidine kinase